MFGIAKIIKTHGYYNFDPSQFYLLETNKMFLALRSEKKNELNQFMGSFGIEYGETTDKETISKSTIIACNIRKIVTGISLYDDSALIISFEKGISSRLF